MDVFQLAPNHVWKAAPGCRILVVDNGGVRCDIPYEWIVYSPRRHVFVIDRFPPDSRSLLAISCKRLPAEVMAFPLPSILREWVNGEDRRIIECGEAIRFHRWPLEVAWLQLRVREEPRPGEKFGREEKCTRVCVARADCTQALLVFDFHPEDETALAPVWQTLMETLAVGDYIADPTTGRKRMRRG
jgi:hypothetical protein